jgi:hypothetical protein
MRLWQSQRNQFTTAKIGGARQHNWRETTVVAVLLASAALASGMRPADEVSAAASMQIQQANIIEDIIDCIDKILGGGSGSSGSGAGTGSGSGGGSTGSGGNP